MNSLSRDVVRRVAKYTGAAGLVGVFAIVGIITYVQMSQASHIHSVLADVQTHPIAIVLGASVKEDGSASDALLDRVLVGVEAYKAGKVEKVLLTGDDGAFRSNEIRAMRAIALENGVPPEAVLTDGQGYRTYESCKRAVTQFDIRDALVITQDFHLNRALYLCSTLGMRVEGLTADKHAYVKIVRYRVRDLFASAKAWWDINVFAPESPVSK